MKFDWPVPSDDKVDLSKVKITYPGRGEVIEEKRPIQWCMDCLQKWPIFFAVRNPIWGAVGIGKGIICLKCFNVRFEKLFGRPLCLEDFRENAIVNESIFFGYQMAINQTLNVD